MIVFWQKRCKFALRHGNGPVVQLDRTSDSGSEDRGLESRRGHRMLESILLGSSFYFSSPMSYARLRWIRPKCLGYTLVFFSYFLYIC